MEGVERRSAAHAPQQVLRTEQGGSLASLAGAELGRLDGNVLGDDSAGDGDGAKQGDRMLGEPRDSLVQRVVEPERHAVEPTARLQEAHELIDEVRAPLRFLGDAPHASAVGLQRVQKEDLREILGVGQTERAHLDVLLTHVAQAAPQRAEQRARLGLLGAVAEDDEHGGCIGHSKQLEEERAAVAVTPLQVVQQKDDLRPHGKALEQLSKCAEGEASQLLRVRDPEGAPGIRCNRPHAREHRKDPRESQDSPRQQRLDVLEWKPAEETTDGVDQAVDGLERHRLALVATTREDDGVAVLRQLLGEAGEQHALAHARAAAHVDHQGPVPGARLAESVAELLHLRLAPDERDIDATGHERGAGGEIPRPGQATQDVEARRPHLGVALEQVAAERVEILGHVGDSRQAPEAPRAACRPAAAGAALRSASAP